MVKMTFWDVAERDLKRFPHPVRRVLLSCCREIFDDWGVGKVLHGPLAGYRMHRMGVYRIIYEVKESSRIEIVAIRHRRDIYERALMR